MLQKYAMNLTHADKKEFINKLTEFVLANLEKENFGVSELAHLTGLNRFALNKRLHAVIDKSTN